MTRRATANFDVTLWDPRPYMDDGQDVPGPPKAASVADAGGSEEPGRGPGVRGASGQGADQAARANPEGPAFSQVLVLKSYRGDVEGEGRALLLTCQADPGDRSAGAGYVASERITGTLDGRRGSFVVHHWGIVASGAPKTAGHVVPGAGTGALAGISGDMEIAVEPGGTHVLRLDYDLE